MGIHPDHVVDTMVMAYLLGDLPQGLKPLAYRLAGMTMRSYDEVIGSRGNAKAKVYLEMAGMLEWPNPEHVLEFREGGVPHIKKPQNIGRKIGSALTKYWKAGGEESGIDLHEKWVKMEGTEVVESAIGPMPRADLRDVPEEEAITYACRDADATLRIYPVLKKRIEDEGLSGVLDMDMATIPMILEMMRVGIRVDLTKMTEVNTKLTSMMAIEEREIQKCLGYTINPGSPPQVAAMLDRERIPVRGKRGKSGVQSTAKELLSPLRKQYLVVDHLLKWSGYETLRSTFTEVLPTQVDSDGRIHATIKTTRTSTGRLAMEDPNLQNIPVRTEEGRMIRDAFVASPGYTLCSWDFSQIELRVLADNSGDEAMIRAFLSGFDLHTATASEMFGIPMSAVEDYKHRRPAKTVNFGIPYGITALGLVDTMNTEGAEGWTEAACQDLIDRWFKARPGVRGFMEECKAFARRNGYIVDMFGRRRWVHEVWSTSAKIREEGLRYAMNQPIQSGAQGIIKLAMGTLWREMRAEFKNHLIRPLIQIHDDLLMEVVEEEVEWIALVVKEIMETIVRLKIPTPVDQKVGERWGSMEKITQDG
jgi:DNA polymerase-1